MSDKMRWIHGLPNLVDAAVDSETVIEIGDLVWQDVDDAKPASALELVGGTFLDDQERFAKHFLGVAMQRSRSGETAPVRVATTGVFEFDLTHAIGPFRLGDLMGVYAHANDHRLSNQQVTKVTSSKHAIARVARRVASADTIVLVDICSTVMRGGIQGSSPSGV